MTPAQRKRQFRAMEQKILSARKGQKQKFQQALAAERLKDLRAVADRTRPGYSDGPQQVEMFAAASDDYGIRLGELVAHLSAPVRGA